MDKMGSVLGDILPAFPGTERRVRCFAHSINLVAKSFLRLFDPQAKKKKRRNKKAIRPEDAEELHQDGNDDDPDGWGALRDAADRIAEGDEVELTEEEQVALDAFLAQEQQDDEHEQRIRPGDDDEDGIIDMEDLTAGDNEAATLEAEAKPIRQALIKVCILCSLHYLTSSTAFRFGQ